jgi:hypothetical protein
MNVYKGSIEEKFNGFENSGYHARLMQRLKPATNSLTLGWVPFP